MRSDNCFRVSATAPLESEHETLDWTLALAGGEGTRLQEYVTRHFGCQLPKQYCPLLGSRSMLEDTLARLNQLTPASRTLTVIGPTHAPYAMPQLARASDHVFRQPASRGTGLALYVALAMIRRWNPTAVVTITPTDHHVEPSARYLEHVQIARSVAARMREAVVILGVRPCSADPDLGYLSLGPRPMDAPEAKRLVDFVEKPPVARAQELINAGALWNTMVMCGTVDAFWSLARTVKRHLIDVLDCLVPLVDTPDEADAIDYIYRTQPPVNFSTDVLERERQRVVAIEVDGIEWSDCGQPERVETVLARRRSRASMPASAMGARPAVDNPDEDRSVRHEIGT
jgi:mannose-1-phosphate guanylyltransferase